LLVLAAACGGGGGSSDPALPAPADQAAQGPGSSGTGDPGAGGSGTGTPTPAPTGSPTGTPVATAPKGLACLAQHYVGTPAQTPSGAWELKLPDGTELPWDDGQTKTFDQTLDNPDLKDTFSIPYTIGPITPVNTVNLDPGRFRQEALFKATFGDSASAVQAKLVDVSFVGQTVKFHSLAAAALTKVSAKLETLIAQDSSLAQYVTGALGGTFNWRPILNTNRMSAHSYGIAIDIVVAKSNYWEWEKKADGSLVWTNKIPQAIVDAFEAEGFAWGGRWYHYDTMHFEYRPELFDPACK
jgi:hypothetical protein